MNTKEIPYIKITGYTKTRFGEEIYTVENTQNQQVYNVELKDNKFNCDCHHGSVNFDTGKICKHIARVIFYKFEGGCLAEEDGHYCGERMYNITENGVYRVRVFHCEKCRKKNRKKRAKQKNGN